MDKKELTNLTQIEYLWGDRKHHMWFPISFTRYRISSDRIFLESGFFNTRSDEILMYRVRDLRVTITLLQRIFGTGTVTIISSDKSIPNMELRNIKQPREVKEFIHRQVEAAKEARRMHAMEIMGGDIDDGVEADEQSS